MKLAAAAFAAATLFLAAVIVGIGRPEAPLERVDQPIQLRQTGPGRGPSPDPGDETEKVDRNVEDGRLDDYDDHRGRGRGRGRGGDDNSGPGSGGDNSGSGSGGDNSGPGSGGDNSGRDDDSRENR